jgi:hypothetical protein
MRQVAAVRSVKTFADVTGSNRFRCERRPAQGRILRPHFDRQRYPGRIVKVIEQAPPAAKTF